MDIFTQVNPATLSLLASLDLNDARRLCEVMTSLRIVCENPTFWEERLQPGQKGLYELLTGRGMRGMDAWWLVQDPTRRSRDLFEYFPNAMTIALDLVQMGEQIHPQVLRDAAKVEGSEDFFRWLLTNTALRITHPSFTQIFPPRVDLITGAGDLFSRFTGSGEGTSFVSSSVKTMSAEELVDLVTDSDRLRLELLLPDEVARLNFR